jgi:hypothetical protein
MTRHVLSRTRPGADKVKPNRRTGQEERGKEKGKVIKNGRFKIETGRIEPRCPGVGNAERK